MKYVNLVILVLFSYLCLGQGSGIRSSFSVLSQFKPPIDSSLFGKWPENILPTITSDGRYFMYIIENRKTNSRDLVLQAIGGDWRFCSAIFGEYLVASEKVIWLNNHDSLCISTLGSNHVFYIPNVLLFSVSKSILFFRLRGVDSGFFTRNLNSGKVEKYSDRNGYLIEIGDKIKLHLTKSNTQKLYVTEAKGNKQMIIWEGTGARNFITHEPKDQLAFVSDSLYNSFWIYNKLLHKAVLINLTIDSNLILSGLSHFSKNGGEIFLNLITKSKVSGKANKTIVNIWSYTDSKLQSQQGKEGGSGIYTAVVNLADHKLTILRSDNDLLFMSKYQDSLVLIRHQECLISSTEASWNRMGEFNWYLSSIMGGTCRRLDFLGQSTIVELSPSGRYIIFFDSAKYEYFVYETSGGHIRCITLGIDEDWVKESNKNSYGRHIANWEDRDSAVYIYGQRDIWKIDPAGILAPINLTNGYGKKHDIIFFLSLGEYSNRSLKRNEPLILSAFNLKTKENGFYKWESGSVGDPDSLSMGPYIYDVKDNLSLPSGSNFAPIKALNENIYVVRRMSAKEAPNYFSTSDFSVFKQLSNLTPEVLYNWYTTELHTWKSLDQRVLQGILYKPEDFDPTKKYPIIFYYYEKRSDALNAYIEPQFLENGCSVNIPYYVSNGYLVFCPDIYFSLGDPMQGAYDAIISAAKYLSKIPYVDSTKMGLQGCSWGAIETNYIVTHSHLFAAACSASGISDWVSGYGSVMSTGEGMQGMYEGGQFRMGGTLWEKPEIYIKNSAVINADKVIAPLLIMHTTDDEICGIANMVEFFTALRRLGKKSWMLVYDGNHGIWERQAEDFSIRMKQFFDHYLKNRPAPIWMTHTIATQLQDLNIGLEFDDVIKTPGEGLPKK